MESAQVMSPVSLSVVRGEPVVIDPCPHGATFLLVRLSYVAFGVFSIDTGCFVSRHEFPAQAIENAAAIFEMNMPHPLFSQYWNAACSLMQTYRLWMWHDAVARVNFPGRSVYFYPPWLTCYMYLWSVES